MATRHLTPDVVRETALDILASFPPYTGIKQSALFKRTEAALEENYAVPKHAIKNALWDLADRFPDFVVKQKTSYREVAVFPTEQLKEAAPISASRYGIHYGGPNESPETPVSYDYESESGVERAGDNGGYKTKQSVLSSKILEIYSMIEYSGILADMAEIQLNYLSEMNPSELERFFKLKSITAELRALRNDAASRG